MKTSKTFIFFVVLLSFSLLRAEKFEFDFSVSHEGWVGDFSDYPAGSEAFYDLKWGWGNLPAEISNKDEILTKGIFLSGNNHSDDLFMFIKRSIENLEPNTNYNLHFEVAVESNIPSGEIGIGGSPGESVYFKIGASTIEPKKEEINGDYLLNVDKGDQSESGENSLVIGTLENPLVDPSDPQFESKLLSNEVPLKVRTDQKGQLWIFVGTDSGFEGSTLYYVAKVSVFAEKSED
ncbi:MAG TPA: hypothetical protein VIH61_00790 [Waddliaceae bacterium]